MTATRADGPLAWWYRIGPVKRVITVVLALAIGVNVSLAALDSVVGSDPGGPTGSSYATGGDGAAGWSDLLTTRGVDVRAIRSSLGDGDLPQQATVLVVEPAETPTPAAVTALAEHLAAGGRVVTVGAEGAAYAGALLGTDLGWANGGPTRPAATGPLLAGLDDLRATGAGTFTTPGPTTVEAGPAAEATIVSAGGLVAVADPTLLQNDHLAEGDNAALAVTLAGAGPVAFAEAEHGYGGASRGLDAVPGRWKATIIGLVIAVLVGSWSFGQRLGPAEASDRPLAPPRRAYVDALAVGLARTSRAADPPPPGGDL